ncbi:MAG: LysM peptidoglycan-binding domain-containing protein [Okeania sp. SIO3B5]|uniref:CIS tube protein n=1 Tax=Okeania sp. SIO3B5 TaxID=2607811 RepID=UPI0013FE7865|nr:LysM peptidoglycan-binding domain-containing protein [Okeania sp. SIO3B5]NEO57749.1 LysM peptidoglycan-binding domain-containing protein [Okeania sp. SIO3B5]
MVIGQQKLTKLTITPLEKQGEQYNRLLNKAISVQFNPEAYSISKSVNWGPPESSSGQGTNTERQVNAPTVEFKGGGSRQLTLELFFDVTEAVNGEDVRQETNKIVTLTRIERDEAHPRVCEVSWGEAPVGSDFPFIGVITSLTQNFTLFKGNGKPLRANLSVSFLEFLAPLVDKRQTDPELTTRIIKRGDTLSSIAAQVYRNPKLWRIIAEANQLDDPRNLEMQIGRTLTIPKQR